MRRQWPPTRVPGCNAGHRERASCLLQCETVPAGQSGRPTVERQLNEVGGLSAATDVHGEPAGLRAGVVGVPGTAASVRTLLGLPGDFRTDIRHRDRLAERRGWPAAGYGAAPAPVPEHVKPVPGNPARPAGEADKGPLRRSLRTDGQGGTTDEVSWLIELHYPSQARVVGRHVRPELVAVQRHRGLEPERIDRKSVV